MKKKKGDGLIESGGHPLFLTSLFGLFLFIFFFLVHVVNSFVNSEICRYKNFKNKKNVVARSYVTKKSLLLFVWFFF